MVTIFLIFKAQLLLDIDFLLNRPILESTFDIHLMKLEIMVSSIGK
jgi:hypothetical protein